MIAASDDALEATALVKRAIAAAELAAKNEIIASGAPVQEQAPVATKRDATYASLSAIAYNITGTAWNGPRFFGLRAGRNRPEDIEDETARSHAGIAAVGRLHRSSISPPRTKVRR